MIGNNFFNNFNITEKALDATWMRNGVISHNIANADTPGFKKKKVEFENQLIKALNNDGKINKNEMENIRPTIKEDSTNLSYRLDENNVDIDVEMVELAKNQIRYNALINRMSHQFNMTRTVLKAK